MQAKACERCWKRKQKCDRQLPRCGNCATSRVECVVRDAEIDGIAAHHGPMTNAAVSSYVNSLKRKVDRLDHAAQNKRHATLSNTTHQHSASQPVDGQHHDAFTSSNTTYQESVSPQADAGHVRATMGEIGFLSRSAMSEARGGTSEFPAQLKLQNLVTAAVSLDRYSEDLPSSLMHPRPSSGGTVLPRDVAAPYLRTFIEQVVPLLPHLDDLALQHDQDVQDAESSQLGYDAACSRFNIYMAVSIGALLTSNSGRVASFATNLHIEAMSLFQTFIVVRESQGTVHCLLLLVVYSTLTSSGGSTWFLLGLAAKVSVALGLHKEPDTELALSNDAIKFRRNLFWSLYLLDRSLSATMDRPFIIQEEDISVKMPEPEHRASLAKVLILQAKLVSRMRGSTESTSFHFSTFCHWQELAESLKPHGRIAEFLDHLACRTLLQILYCYRERNERQTVIGTFQRLKDMTSDTCERFVDRMYNEMDSSGFVCTLFDGYDIFSAGLIALDHRFPSSAAITPPLVDKCLTLLTVIGERFASLRPLRRVLSTLATVRGEGSREHQSVRTPLSSFIFNRLKSTQEQLVLKDLPSELPYRTRSIIADILAHVNNR